MREMMNTRPQTIQFHNSEVLDSIDLIELHQQGIELTLHFKPTPSGYGQHHRIVNTIADSNGIGKNSGVTGNSSFALAFEKSQTKTIISQLQSKLGLQPAIGATITDACTSLNQSKSSLLGNRNSMFADRPDPAEHTETSLNPSLSF